MSSQFEDRGEIKRYNVTNIAERLSAIHGERYKKYRENWDLATKGLLIPEKPLYFFMEPTSHCNLNCKMCYRSKSNSTQKVYNMPIEIIKNVMAQCKEMNVPSMTMSSSSECLIHPKAREIIKIIKEAGFIDFILITNGQALTEEILRLLIDLQVERLCVSLDAATEDTYKKIRGASLQRVENTIDKFLEIRQEKKSLLPFLRISFVMMEQNIHEKDIFLSKWQKKADIIDFQEYIDFSHVDNLKDVSCEPFLCPHPFQRIGIDHKGDIYPCCSFYQKYLKLGNIKDTLLIDAWNSALMKELRRSFLENKPLKVCKNCYSSILKSDETL